MVFDKGRPKGFLILKVRFLSSVFEFGFPRKPEHISPLAPFDAPPQKKANFKIHIAKAKRGRRIYTFVRLINEEDDRSTTISRGCSYMAIGLLDRLNKK